MARKTAHIKAAETALGLEPIGEETREEALLRQRWERYFAPLGLALPDEHPPADMWYRIRGALDRADDRQTLARTRGKVTRWRAASVAMTALAAGLAALLYVEMADPDRGVERETSYVAVITPEDARSAVIVEVDLEAGVARIRPVGVDAPEGKSLQVWTARPDGSPRPVGLLDTDTARSFEVDADPGDAFAVSVEPEGGSPTGSPTGEVIYHGYLMPVPD